MAKFPTFEVQKSGHGRTVVDANCWPLYEKRGFEPVDKEVMELALKGKFPDGTTVDGRNMKEIEKKQIAEIKRQKAEKKRRKAAQSKTGDLKDELEQDKVLPEFDEIPLPEASGKVSERAKELIETVVTLNSNKSLKEFCEDNKIDLDLAAIPRFKGKNGRKVAVAKYIKDNF